MNYQVVERDRIRMVGVTCNYDKEDNTVEYWDGVESSAEAPNGFSVTELLPAKWVAVRVEEL